MKYKKLNIDWNAEPNAPNPKISVDGDLIEIEFLLNPFIFDHIKDDELGKLTFKNCHKYSFNDCNDEGYFREQYRYRNDELPWGEFYELEHDWLSDFHPDCVILNSPIETSELKHFIMFFRDNTFECVASDFQFEYLKDETTTQ